MRKPRVYWRALRKEWSRDGWEPTDWGNFLSLSLIVLVLRIGLIQDDGVAKVDQFLRLSPSEMGDTIAGLFSALAFIWIIVTVFIQSRELREQRKEFRQQREATQRMARAMGAQSKVFEDELRYRRENEASNHLSELLSSLKAEVGALGHTLTWYFSSKKQPDEFSRPLGRRFHLFTHEVGDDFLEVGLPFCVDRFEKQVDELFQNAAVNNLVEKELPSGSQLLEELLEITGAIELLGPSFSKADKERLRRVKIGKLRKILMKIESNELLWENS